MAASGTQFFGTSVRRPESAFAFKAAHAVRCRAAQLQVLSVGSGPRPQGPGPRQGGPGQGQGQGQGGPYRASNGVGVRTVPRPGPGQGQGGATRSFDSDDGGRRGGYGGGGGRGRPRGNDRRGGPPPTIVPINEDIRAREVRVIGEDKSPLGVMSFTAAMDMAKDMTVDLVLVVQDANPPVCRLISYSKFKYELDKADKDKKKQQRESRIDTKEVKLRPSTDTHDYDTKVRQAQKFLAKGDRVKVTLQFKGREMENKDIGREMFNRLLLDLESEAVLEQKPSMQGRSMNMVLAPKKTVPV